MSTMINDTNVKLAEVKELCALIEEEIYYGFNLRLVMMRMTSTQLSAIRKVFQIAHDERIALKERGNQ